jgi:hypothetical protein
MIFDTSFKPSYTRAKPFWLVVLPHVLEDTTLNRRTIGLGGCAMAALPAATRFVGAGG